MNPVPNARFLLFRLTLLRRGRFFAKGGTIRIGQSRKSAAGDRPDCFPESTLRRVLVFAGHGHRRWCYPLFLRADSIHTLIRMRLGALSLSFFANARAHQSRAAAYPLPCLCVPLFGFRDAARPKSGSSDEGRRGSRRGRRMGSFTSAPKVPNEDAEDPDVSIPTQMTRDALLERCRWEHSRLPALIRRNFRCIAPSKESEENGEDWTLSSGVRLVGWNLLSRVCSSTASPNHLRVLQWNVLSQALGQENDNFMCCPEEALEWQTRRFQMLEEILEYNPDIICLQEVDHFGFLYRALSSVGYVGTFFPKPDSPCLYVPGNNGPDGCAIFFRAEKFQLMSVDTRILEVWRVQSNQVAIIARLSIRETGQQILVCTTHLKARKGALLSTLRNEQGRDLLDFIARHAAATEAEIGKRPPVIVCGDFNAEPIEPVYSSILSDKRLSLASAYAQYPVTPTASNMVNGNAEDVPDDKEGRLTPLESGLREPPYTTWKVRESEGEVCHTIDYIFHSHESLAVEAFLEFPTGEDIGPGRVPSLSYPSDHFSLVCDFQIHDPSGKGVVSKKEDEI